MECDAAETPPRKAFTDVCARGRSGHLSFTVITAPMMTPAIRIAMVNSMSERIGNCPALVAGGGVEVAF